MKFKPLIFWSIILLGAFLRFYKLDWGQGLFAHPDEYHIVGSVAQLSFPLQMNPHFFSYGTVTIYLIYFTQELIKYLSMMLNIQLTLPNSFFVGRFYSALFSTLSIFVVYKICRIIFSETKFTLFATLLIAITPGLIQQAHFATPESALTFFLLVSLFFTLRFIKQNSILFLELASLSLGFAMGVKISSVVFLLPLTVSILINSWPKNLPFKVKSIITKKILKYLLRFARLSIMSIAIVTISFFIAAPFVFLDFHSFGGNLEYEGGLAAGKFLAFYTRQFIDTVPVLFQLKKILPYALGTPLLSFSILGFFVLLFNSVKKMKAELIIFVISFLSIFITNAFLFAKWTRFIAPSFPFFAIFATYLLRSIHAKSKSVSKILGAFLLAGTFVWTTAYFAIYLHKDIRITASNWVEKELPEKSTILVEGGNMVDIPLGGNFSRISLDFYSLEENPQTRFEIASALNSSNYFIVQSRRVFMNHQRLPKTYPVTANFYNMLFAGKMGFEEVAEFHSFPQIQIGTWKIEIPDEKAEETWSVFDHPVIRIFKKTQPLSVRDYEKILEI